WSSFLQALMAASCTTSSAALGSFSITHANRYAGSISGRSNCSKAASSPAFAVRTKSGSGAGFMPPLYIRGQTRNLLQPVQTVSRVNVTASDPQEAQIWNPFWRAELQGSHTPSYSPEA